MSVVKNREHDTQLIIGLRAALRKARELGYEVERMDVTASLSEGMCNIYFAPMAAPGKIASGGDVSLTVDTQTEEVVKFRRGQ